MIAIPPMLEVSGQHSLIDYSIGFALIAKAITEGHDDRLLRWRMSADQAVAAFNLAVCIGNEPPALEFVRTGAIFSRGNYCGLPISVDHGLPQGTVLLEKLEPSVIGRIQDPCIPSRFNA